MAVRIRKDRKTIVCAAEFPAEDGDCYLDDGVHYCLAVEMGVLHTDDEGDSWYFDSHKPFMFKKAPAQIDAIGLYPCKKCGGTYISVDGSPTFPHPYWCQGGYFSMGDFSFYRKWNRLWLWLFRTRRVITPDGVVEFKLIRGRKWITKTSVSKVEPERPWPPPPPHNL